MLQKIVKALCKIKNNKQKLYLEDGAKRDWGHAEDYVIAMENLTNKKADDWVICTGKQYSVKEFINLVAKKINLKLIGEVRA